MIVCLGPHHRGSAVGTQCTVPFAHFPADALEDAVEGRQCVV